MEICQRVALRRTEELLILDRRHLSAQMQFL